MVIESLTPGVPSDLSKRADFPLCVIGAAVSVCVSVGRVGDAATGFRVGRSLWTPGVKLVVV